MLNALIQTWVKEVYTHYHELGNKSSGKDKTRVFTLSLLFGR